MLDLAREEHVRVARRLVGEHRDVGAIVLECTNMPPYAAAGPPRLANPLGPV